MVLAARRRRCCLLLTLLLAPAAEVGSLSTFHLNNNNVVVGRSTGRRKSTNTALPFSAAATTGRGLRSSPTFSSPRSSKEEVSTKSRRYTFTSDEDLFKSLREKGIRPPGRRSNDPDYTSSTRTFNYMLRQLADSGSGRSDAGPCADAVLQYMLDQSSSSSGKGRPELRPDAVTLNTVLDAYSKSVGSSTRRAEKQANADAALRLFTEWQDLHENEMVPDDVDLVSYNTLISFFGKAGMTEAAEQMFDRLKKRHETTGDDAYRPDAHSFSSLLHAFAVAGQASKVGSIFQQMQRDGPQPTIHSFNDVLYAYSKSNHPDSSSEFLQWWCEEDRGSLVRPDTRSYNIVLHSLVKGTKSAERAERLFESIPHPDKISYTTLVSALSRIPGRASLEAIDRVIDRAWQDGYVQVDAGFVANVLYSVALCDDRSMPAYAERMVADMIVRGMTSDLSVYNALIYCWGSSNDRDAPRRAVELLTELESREVFEPDMRTYANVLQCLSKSRDPKAVGQAESIVQRMEESSPGAPPNVQVYTTLIQNYARSRLPDKATKAANVLERMKTAAVRPNIVSYNAVLNTCEHTNPNEEVTKEEALKVACIVFDEVRSCSTVVASHVTYGTFLGVLANLMPEGSRQQIVELVFRRCCMEGQVSRLVLRKLRGAVVSDQKFYQLLKGHGEDRLPHAWTCNVREVRARNCD